VETTLIPLTEIPAEMVSEAQPVVEAQGVKTFGVPLALFK